MGIVLKRRDNADIVKDIYGGVIDILMKDGDVGKAVKFTKIFLQKIIDGNVDIKKLIISKETLVHLFILCTHRVQQAFQSASCIALVVCCCST